MGNVFRWTGAASSNFGTAQNWYDVTTGATSSVVPGPSDDALVAASGGIGGDANVLELALTGTATGLTLTGLLQGQLVYLEGQVTLAASAQLSAHDLLDIGDGTSDMPGGTGADDITLDGGSEIDVVADAVNSGGIVVGQNGADTELSLAQQGALGSRVLSYAYGGSTALLVGSDTAAGVVSVSGSGSALGAFGKSVAGVAAASGWIEVTAGARVVLGADAAGEGLSLGVSGGHGSLTLAGASQGLLAGQAVVGASGDGTLSVTGGSGLVAQSTTGAALLVGGDASGTGSVLVSDPYSFIDVSGGLAVGGAGTGVMTVQDQSRVVSGDTPSPSTPALSIGASVGGNGSVTVASQAELVALGAGIAVGVYGDGTLSVQSADVTITTAPSASVSALDAGVGAGSHGVVEVSGGLILDTQAAGMIIGDSGSGTMTIGDGSGQGGLVLTGDPTAAAGVSLGVASGAEGTVSISGTASGLGVYGAIDDGIGGQGSIGVTDGGHLIVTHGPTVDGLVLGASGGGSGTMTVDDGAQAYVLGFTVVGDAGSGSLTIDGGSSFTGVASGGYVGGSPRLDGAMVLGYASTGTGSVLISDPGTYVPLDGLLVVGDLGSGSLSVTNGAILTVSVPPAAEADAGEAAVTVGADLDGTGTLSVSGHAQAIIEGGVEIGEAGRGELDVSGATLTYGGGADGEMRIEGNEDGFGPGVVNVAGGVIDDVAGSGLRVSGTLTISQVGSVGGTVLTGGSGGGSLMLYGQTSLYPGGLDDPAFISVSGSASGLGVFGETQIEGGTLALSAGARLVTGGDAPFSYGLQITGPATAVSLSGGAQASVAGETDLSTYGSLSITGGSGFTGVLGQTQASEGQYAMRLEGLDDTVLISDPTTYASLTGGVLVGDGANGFGTGASATLTVANGAVAVVAADGAADVGVAIGNDMAGDTLTVEGGSLLADTGQFSVGAAGNAGQGDLVISSGGTVTVTEIAGQTGPAVAIGAGNGSLTTAVAAATVTGAGSDWSVGGALYVGVNDLAAASLRVTDGGQVHAGAVVTSDLQNGLVYVDGAGSTLDATSFTLGGNVPGGTLNVADGGLVNVSGGMGLNGSVELFGGTLMSGATVSVSAQSAINGYGMIGGSVLDLGAIATNGGTMTCLGTVTGTGDLTVGNGVLVLDSGEAASVGVAFLSGGATLVAQATGNIAGMIAGWASGDFVDLQNVSATSESFANGTLSLFGTDAQPVGTLRFAGALTTDTFSLTTLAGGGTQIGYHS